MGSQSRSYINGNETRSEFGQSRLNVSNPLPTCRPQNPGSPDEPPGRRAGSPQREADRSWATESYLKTREAIHATVQRQTNVTQAAPQIRPQSPREPRPQICPSNAAQVRPPSPPSSPRQPQPQPQYPPTPSTVTVTETEIVDETVPAEPNSPINEQRNVVSVTNLSADNVMIRTVKETVTTPPASSPRSESFPQAAPGTTMRPQYPGPQVRQASPQSPQFSPIGAGPSQRPIQGTPASFRQGSPQRPPQGTPASFRQGSPQRPPQGTPASFRQGSPQRPPQGTPASFRQGSPQRPIQGTPASFRQGSPQRPIQGTPASFRQNDSQFRQGSPQRICPPAQPQRSFRQSPTGAVAQQPSFRQDLFNASGMQQASPRQSPIAQRPPSQVQRYNPFEGNSFMNSFGSIGASPQQRPLQPPSPQPTSPRPRPQSASPRTGGQPIQIQRIASSSQAQAGIQTFRHTNQSQVGEESFYTIPRATDSYRDPTLPQTYSRIADMTMDAGEGTLAGNYTITQDEQMECMVKFAAYANKAMDDFVLLSNEKLLAIEHDLEEALHQDPEMARRMAERAEEIRKVMKAEDVSFRQHLLNMHHVYMKKCKQALRAGKRREVETVVTEPNKVITERVIEQEGGPVTGSEEQGPPEDLPSLDVLNGTIGVLYANALKSQEEQKTRLQEEMEQQLLLNPGPETTTKYNLLKEELLIKFKQQQDCLLAGYREAARRDLEAKSAQGPSSTTKEVVDERIVTAGQGEQRRTTTTITTVGGSSKTNMTRLEEFYKIVDCRAKMRQELEARQQCELQQAGGEDPTLKEKHVLQIDEFNATSGVLLAVKFNEMKANQPQFSQPVEPCPKVDTGSLQVNKSVTETTIVKETHDDGRRTEITTVTTQSPSKSEQPCPPQTPCAPESRQVQFASPLCSKTSPAYRGASWSSAGTESPYNSPRSGPNKENQMFSIYSSPDGQSGNLTPQPQRAPFGQCAPPGGSPQYGAGKVTETTTETKTRDGATVRTEVTTVTTCTNEVPEQGGIAICSAEPVQSKTDVCGDPCGQKVKSAQSMPDMKNGCTCNCNKFKGNDLVPKTSKGDCSCPCKSMMPSVRELCELEQMEKEEMIRSLRRWHIARRDIIATMAQGKKAC